MKIVSYNIRYGLGKDQRIDLARIAHAVRGADVIALQEVERNWPRPEAQSLEDQPQILADLLPEYYWVFVPAFDVDASTTMPNGHVVNRRRQHGVMLLAKTPVLSARPLVLPKHAHEDLFNMRMGALEGVVAPNGSALRVYVVHFGYLTDEERMVQLDALLSWIAAAPAEGGAWSGPPHPLPESWTNGEMAPPLPASAVLLGDFNARPDSSVYARITGDANKTTQTSEPFLDTWVAAGHEVHAGITFPGVGSRGREVNCRIDHCFVTPDLASSVSAAWIDSEAQGSDHQPIWIELKL